MSLLVLVAMVFCLHRAIIANLRFVNSITPFPGVLRNFDGFRPFQFALVFVKTLVCMNVVLLLFHEFVIELRQMGIELLFETITLKLKVRMRSEILGL